MEDLALQAEQGKGLSRSGNRVREDDLGQAILVFGIGVGDVGLGFLEFGLAEVQGRQTRH